MGQLYLFFVICDGDLPSSIITQGRQFPELNSNLNEKIIELNGWFSRTPFLITRGDLRRNMVIAAMLDDRDW